MIQQRWLVIKYHININIAEADRSFCENQSSHEKIKCFLHTMIRIHGYILNLMWIWCKKRVENSVVNKWIRTIFLSALFAWFSYKQTQEMEWWLCNGRSYRVISHSIIAVFGFRLKWEISGFTHITHIWRQGVSIYRLQPMAACGEPEGWWWWWGMGFGGLGADLVRPRHQKLVGQNPLQFGPSHLKHENGRKCQCLHCL